jgi:hypothetical protein
VSVSLVLVVGVLYSYNLVIQADQFTCVDASSCIASLKQKETDGVYKVVDVNNGFVGPDGSFDSVSKKSELRVQYQLLPGVWRLVSLSRTNNGDSTVGLAEIYVTTIVSPWIRWAIKYEVATWARIATNAVDVRTGESIYCVSDIDFHRVKVVGGKLAPIEAM